ncbi:MAG: hypothetical protein ACREH3_00795 [Geminicoccales bacterium]
MDAEAICEAVQRPGMRLVAVKSAEQQAALMRHRGRALLIRQRTMLANAPRGHLAELRSVAAKGIRNLKALVALVADETDSRIPPVARPALRALCAQISALREPIGELENAMHVWRLIR